MADLAAQYARGREHLDTNGVFGGYCRKSTFLKHLKFDLPTLLRVGEESAFLFMRPRPLHRAGMGGKRKQPLIVDAHSSVPHCVPLKGALYLELYDGC